MTIKISSAKAKGRNLQNHVRDLILKLFPQLQEDDVRSTPMGVNGADIQLSTLAKKVFPYQVECKNTEKLNVWQAYEQAVTNVSPNTTPLLIFKRNRSKIMVCIELDNFVKLLNTNSQTVE